MDHYKKMEEDFVEVPVIIGGEEIFTDKQGI